MLLIIKDNKIIGIEKELVTLLKSDLSSLAELSEIIDLLNLKISALRNEVFNIKNIEFNVKKVNCLSVENIEIFNLTTVENYQEKTYVQNESSKEHLLKIDLETETKEENFNNLIKLDEHKNEENKKTENEVILKEPELKFDLNKEPVLNVNLETETKEENFDNLIKLDEHKNEEIKKTENEVKLKEPELKIDVNKEPILNVNLETEKKEENFDNLIKLNEHKNEETTSENKINESEFKINTEEKIENKDKKVTVSELKEDKFIEISFEDDLAEINEILKLNKDEFNKAIKSELEKASNELGIDYNTLIELYNQLLEQIKEEKNYIYGFIENKDYDNLHKSYHKLKGAALNLRLSKIALVLKTLDELSKKHDLIEKIKKVTNDFYFLIENDTEKLKIDKTTNLQIEDIVIKTIQTYLDTQNEKEFQNDKKYIEKLLGTKINSIDELRQIVKGIS